MPVRNPEDAATMRIATPAGTRKFTAMKATSGP